jgi:hypothetical protein
MVTCITQGQDPYQLICGTIGGYVMVYDIRYSMVSSSYKHSQKYPINSVATFKPQLLKQIRKNPDDIENKKWKLGAESYNRSMYNSPMAMIATGSKSYELALTNLDNGFIEKLYTVRESDEVDERFTEIPYFGRESMIRDSASYPEKAETNQSLYNRYLMQTKSLVNSNQIKLTQIKDDKLLKDSKDRYKLVK